MAGSWRRPGLRFVAWSRYKEPAPGAAHEASMAALQVKRDAAAARRAEAPPVADTPVPALPTDVGPALAD